jgi:hypothetical protein
MIFEKLKVNDSKEKGNTALVTDAVPSRQLASFGILTMTKRFPPDGLLKLKRRSQNAVLERLNTVSVAHVCVSEPVMQAAAIRFCAKASISMDPRHLLLIPCQRRAQSNHPDTPE